MTGTGLEGVPGHCKILLGTVGFSIIRNRSPELFYLRSNSLLQFIELPTIFSFHFRSHRAELLEKCSDLSFLSKETDTCILNLFTSQTLEFIKLGENFLDLFFHINCFLSYKDNYFPPFFNSAAALRAFSARLSRAFLSLAAPPLRYFFH